MLKMILFICLLPFAMMEIFFYKQFGLVVVGTLYFVLTLQADRAANRFLSDAFAWRFPTRQSERRRKQAEAVEEEEIAVPPLHAQPGQPGYYSAMRKDEPTEERPIETVRLTRPSPLRANATQPRAQAAPLPERPKAPNYRGPAHEVLAVPENAATRTIKRAFRFWIKQVHPDHNPASISSMANLQVQKITEAKDLLLERRRAKKAG
jgi:hypothetical protein